MKAKEAPEKIFIFEDELQREDHKVMYGVNQDKGIEGLIEYTRTDAFIEKACKWLKDNITYIHPRKGTKECIVNLTKFKDYMKGE